MALSDVELEQLRKVLYTHLLVLDTLLSSPDRWVLDLHIPIAGQLRVLLCDTEMPVLLIYARERGIPLRVWGPRPAGIGLKTELLFSFDALVASWQPVANGHEMAIDEYLDTGVAVTPLEGQVEGRAYSPRQIIKWVANKEGGSHFSFDKPATLKTLNKSVWKSGEAAVDAFQVKHVVFGIAEWTRLALAHCLGFEIRAEPPPEADHPQPERSAMSPPAAWQMAASRLMDRVGHFFIKMGSRLLVRGG